VSNVNCPSLSTLGGGGQIWVKFGSNLVHLVVE
jgi:hypothetical protein